MDWKNAIVSACITICIIVLFKQITKKVNIPIAKQLMDEV